MADTTLSVEKMGINGLAATYNAMSTANTYFARNGGRLFLHFKKSGAGDADVTIVATKSVLGLSVEDLVVTVPASTGDVMIGPFPPGVFNNGDGDISFTVDEDTGLTCAVVEI